jgi:hypothetical protein
MLCTMWSMSCTTGLQAACFHCTKCRHYNVRGTVHSSLCDVNANESNLQGIFIAILSNLMWLRSVGLSLQSHRTAILIWLQDFKWQVPNFMVEWLTFLLRIWDFPSSNLCQETGYPDPCFSWFLSVPPGKSRDSRPTLKLGHGRFHAHPFKFIIHESYFHLTLYSLSYWESVVK